MCRPSEGAIYYSKFRAAFDDAVLASVEHQLHLAATVGPRPKWRLHPAEGTAEFITRDGHIITAVAHPIGVHQNSTWTWSWADSRISEDRTTAARQVFAYGLEHSIGVFTRPVGDLTLSRGKVSATDMAIAAKIIHRLWHHYAFPMPGGAQLFTALQLPDIHLPAPSAAAVAQTLRTAESLHTITKHRRSLVSYANIRGLTRQDSRTRPTMRLHAGDEAVDVSWGKAHFEATPARATLDS